jgi:hypothetical protein
MASCSSRETGFSVCIHFAERVHWGTYRNQTFQTFSGKPIFRLLAKDTDPSEGLNECYALNSSVEIFEPEAAHQAPPLFPGSRTSERSLK